MTLALGLQFFLLIEVHGLTGLLWDLVHSLQLWSGCFAFVRGTVAPVSTVLVVALVARGDSGVSSHVAFPGMEVRVGTSCFL